MNSSVENNSKNNNSRNITLLIILLIVFALIFFISFLGLQRQEAFFDIGIPIMIENWLIMILSVASMIKVVWELYKK
ncbi:MAG: hypothetical protein ACP5N1_02230 [Candidatus Woesearchaeota archaeon]